MSSAPKKESDQDDSGRSFWKDFRQNGKESRQRSRVKNTRRLILLLRIREIPYIQLTEFQIRIANVIDAYPTKKKYHDLRNQTRGTYGAEEWLLDKVKPITKAEKP